MKILARLRVKDLSKSPANVEFVTKTNLEISVISPLASRRWEEAAAEAGEGGGPPHDRPRSRCSVSNIGLAFAALPSTPLLLYSVPTSADF